MPTSLSIPKDPVYPASMDFLRLRREGIRHIERLGSAIWTDYNDHDPGITTLEVLDYAITDLGYRTNWSPADLFALPTQRKPYPTAVDILTNGPVTALDLRKLLIDLDGVRNAWIECKSEPDVFITFTDDQKKSLSAVKKPEKSTVPPAPTDPVNLFSPSGIYTILLEIEEVDEEDVDAIKRNALARLHQYRNLCEDIDPVVKILDTEPIGVCATLEFAPAADPDAVLAAVINAIDNYLAPPVQFYTLQERLDKYGRFQLSTDSLANLSDAALPADLLTALQPLENQEVVNKQAFLQTVRAIIGDTAMADYEALIFFHTAKIYDSHPVYQGPLLDHGFIDEDELEAAQLRRTIYKSDLYQVILQVPDVVGIQSLEMGRCKHNEDGADTLDIEATWCLSFDCECQIRFDADCSTFHYAKGNSYTRLDTEMAAQQARWLQMRQNFSVVRKDDMDLASPFALFRPDFLDYTSIQEDFPQTYHIGRDGLASNESLLRKAQAKQLKGYLLFYDQILANYLAQLAKVRELLAIDGTDRFPAGFLSLDGIVPNVQPLLVNYDIKNESFRELMEGVELDQQLYQSKVMDYLLARFGEQFTDYVLTLYQTDKLIDDGDLVGNGLTDWIADKQNLLTNLPQLGRERARGFNYRAAPQQQNAHIWNPDEKKQSPSLFANVEGLKQRVCALLGIADASRHTITCEPNFFTDVFQSSETRAKRYRFGVKAQETDPMYVLVGTETFKSENLADDARVAFENLSLDTTRYDIVAEPDTDRFVVGFWIKPASEEPRTYENALLRSPKAYPEENATERLGRLTKLIKETCQDDSFHIIEHILLRPINEHYGPLLSPLPATDTDTKWLDPYSFRISIVVPDWVERYQDEQQFYLFSQTLRAETPAHVAIGICRYNREQMLAFETAYYNLLVEYSFPKTDPDDIQRVTNDLVTVLNNNSSQCISTNPQKPTRPTC